MKKVCAALVAAMIVLIGVTYLGPPCFVQHNELVVKTSGTEMATSPVNAWYSVNTVQREVRAGPEAALVSILLSPEQAKNRTSEPSRDCTYTEASYKPERCLSGDARAGILTTATSGSYNRRPAEHCLSSDWRAEEIQTPPIGVKFNNSV